jgi:hypothetical protein
MVTSVLPFSEFSLSVPLFEKKEEEFRVFEVLVASLS